MKRYVSICCIFLVLSVLVAGFTGSSAAIKVKTIGRSLNQLPTGSVWNMSPGLRAIGIQSRSYFNVDTVGSGATGAPTWSLVRPGGSTAILDSATGKFINSFKADVGGQYIVSATVGAQSASDTVFASVYTGVTSQANAGCACHNLVPGFNNLVTSWRNSAHGTIFKRGMTGNLEVEHGKGAYASSCIKCHTTAWDPNANNNNFGYQAKATGFDTSWYRGLEFFGGDYWITTGDTSKWALLNPTQQMQANIGCEQCHGPVADHRLTAEKSRIGKTLDAGVCNQCHDGSARHSLGTYYNTSAHAILPSSEPAYNCQPCHTGAGFLYYMNNGKDTTGIRAVWNPATDGTTKISCQTCHDPHGNSNPYQLRTMTLKGDSLRNGYILPASQRSKTGNLCANCHSSRYRTQDRVKPNSPPYYGFVTRYGPHENPQADMYFGTSGYQYGDETFAGLTTHAGLEGGCATCHMQGRMRSGNTLPNHSFSMTDTTYGFKAVTVCKTCHGEIEDFNDIRAFYDYDRNGQIQGVETEIQGLLTILKARLPLDPATGEPVTMTKDSLLVKNNFAAISGIWNYYMVVNDGSKGMHNTKYALRLLYKSLGWTPLSTDVKDLAGKADAFALSQNYPNPFNPTTTIRFSLPTDQHATLQVFDVTGSLVKTLLDETMRSGNMEATWDGTNSTGTRVSSGMYLYRLRAGNFIVTKKMIMMK